MYGYALEDSGIEIQSLRLSAIGRTDAPRFKLAPAGDANSGATRKSKRKVWFGGGRSEIPVFEGAGLKAGNEIAGPAIIEEPTTTVLIDPGWKLRVDKLGSYLLWPASGDLDSILARLSRSAEPARPPGSRGK